MRGAAIFLLAFVSGALFVRCSSHDAQLSDQAARDICRVVTYDTDGGDPLHELVRFVDEIDRRRRDGGRE